MLKEHGSNRWAKPLLLILLKIRAQNALKKETTLTN